MSLCCNCDKNDGLCYTSNPPQYKCTLDGQFHYGMDGCDLYNKGVESGIDYFYDKIKELELPLKAHLIIKKLYTSIKREEENK